MREFAQELDHASEVKRLPFGLLHCSQRVYPAQVTCAQFGQTVLLLN